MAHDLDFGWQLPTVVNPDEYWCYSISVPQDISYLRALRGAIGELAYSYNWQSDVAETAKLVATKWLVQIAEAEQRLVAGDCGDMDCESIIACINNPNSGVSDAILNIFNEALAVLSLAQSQGENSLGGENNPTCNKDMWYGGIDNLVNSINEHNQDALQILEVSTNVYEWVGQVATGVFGIEAPIFQSMLDWGAFVQQSIMENYEAQWTQQYRETITCDLLCIAMDNCELTPELLINYFYGRLNSQLTFRSLLDESLGFIFLGTWSGTEIVDAMILSQLAIRAQLGRWFELIAFNSLDTDVRLGFNDASNDWELICDDCVSTFYLEADLTSGDHGVLITDAVYSSGIGFIETDSGGVSRCYIRYETIGAWSFKAVSFQFTKTPATTTGSRGIKIRNDLGVQDQILTVDGGSFPTLTEYVWTGSESDIDRFDMNVNSSPQYSDVVISRIRVKIESSVVPQEFFDDGWTTYIP